jgi:hypothetical protein
VLKVTAQQLQALVATIELAKSVEQALRDQRQVRGILLFDALPGFDRCERLILLEQDVALEQAGANAFAVALERRLQVADRQITARANQLGSSQFAVILGDFLV